MVLNLSENCYLVELKISNSRDYMECRTIELVYICNWSRTTAVVRVASKGNLRLAEYYELFIGTSIDDVKSKIEQYAGIRVEYRDC